MGWYFQIPQCYSESVDPFMTFVWRSAYLPHSRPQNPWWDHNSGVNRESTLESPTATFVRFSFPYLHLSHLGDLLRAPRILLPSIKIGARKRPQSLFQREWRLIEREVKEKRILMYGCFSPEVKYVSFCSVRCLTLLFMLWEKFYIDLDHQNSLWKFLHLCNHLSAVYFHGAMLLS